MPLYSYKCPECGKVQEHLMRMHDIHPEFMDCACGKAMARRSIADDLADRKQYGMPGNWPMVSNAVAVHSSQIQEAYEASVRAGCPTQFTKKGQPVFTSPGHQVAYLNSIGKVNLDGNRGGRSRADVGRSHEQLVE